MQAGRLFFQCAGGARSRVHESVSALPGLSPGTDAFFSNWLTKKQIGTGTGGNYATNQWQ
jgi:hypothetical protein